MYFHQRHIMSGWLSYDDISSHRRSLPRLGLANLCAGQTVNLLGCGPCSLYHNFLKLLLWCSSSHGQSINEWASMSSNKTYLQEQAGKIQPKVHGLLTPAWILCFIRGLQNVDILILSFLFRLLVRITYKERFLPLFFLNSL